MDQQTGMDDLEFDTPTLREQYIRGDILTINAIVESVESPGTFYTVIDRGAAYVTVANADGEMSRKWIAEVRDTGERANDPTVSDGQVEFAGMRTSHLTEPEASMAVLAYTEGCDLFAYRLGLFALDECAGAMASGKYDPDAVFEKLSTGFTKFARVDADAAASLFDYRIDELVQHGIRFNLSRLVGADGFDGAIAKIAESAFDPALSHEVASLLYAADSVGVKFPETFVEYTEVDRLCDVLDECIDELADDMNDIDIIETFGIEDEKEFDALCEVLSQSARLKMSRSMHSRESILGTRRARAIEKSASPETIAKRSRAMAINMIKQRTFHKPPSQMTRAEKEHFEQTASRRKALVSKLSMRMAMRVREIQAARMHGKGK